MGHKLNCIAALLTAGAVAFGIATAPAAAADPASYQTDNAAVSAASPSAPARVPQSCTSSGGTQTICQSPGNVQIYAAVPRGNYYRYTGGAI